MGTLQAKHISVSVECPPSRVYEFASDVENLPLWASGLSIGAITQNGDDWVVESPMGEIRVRFAEKNNFGVLDHDVTLESGDTFNNPMRVIPNGEGSELIFTLYKQPDMSDEKFNEDTTWIKKDLTKLKNIVEQG